MALHKKWSFSIKDLLSKRDEIRMKLRIWLDLLKKSLMENFTFCAVLLNLNRSWLSGALIDVLHFVQLANYLYCQERKKGKIN